MMNAGRVLGLILDVSLAHTSEGTRVLDVLKKQLIDFTRETMDGEDLFYLYHPLLVDPVYDIGQIVSTIGNYETDGWPFDLRYALKLTYYVVLNQDEDAQKMIMLVTDRARDQVAIEKLLFIEEREQCGCQFIFVGVGNNYRKSLFDLDHEQVRHFHLECPSDFNTLLLERTT